MKPSPPITNFLRQSKHSETLLINQLSIERTANNQTVYKFGFGQSPFPVPKAITQALADAAHRKEYMSVQGHLPLREAIANFHRIKEGKEWQSEHIIIGAGSKILLFCVMAAFEQAEILLPAPSWVSYEPQAKLAGHKIHWLNTTFTHRWKISPEQLERFCLQRSNPEIPLILILNYPSNPSGQTYDKTELSALAAVMRKHKVIVIADEIYSLLTYQQSYASIADYYPEGCIISSGLSKWCGAGGWRLGFMYIPPQLEQLMSTVIGVASETYSCASSPIQIAATKAYQDLDLADDYLTKQRRILNEISQYCCKELKKSGLKVHAAQGGFYLFPDFINFKNKLTTIGINTSEQLTSTLMQDIGVALLPGSAFGMDNYSLTTRLAFVDFNGEQIFRDSSISSEFNMVKKGIHQLCQWLAAL